MHWHRQWEQWEQSLEVTQINTPHRLLKTDFLTFLTSQSLSTHLCLPSQRLCRLACWCQTSLSCQAGRWAERGDWRRDSALLYPASGPGLCHCHCCQPSSSCGGQSAPRAAPSQTHPSHLCGNRPPAGGSAAHQHQTWRKTDSRSQYSY